SREPKTGGSLFGGFGKKKSPAVQGPDSSLFPDGSAQHMTGGTMVGNNTSASLYTSPTNSPAISSSPGVIMPTTQAPAKEKKKLFGGGGLKPSQPKLRSSSPTVNSTSVINNNGNNYYVVKTSTRMVPYGQNAPVVLPVGAVVQMTKPGENYATVSLNNGLSGVIGVRALRPASSADLGQ
ncbi:MAG: hypothetical protein AAF226_14675, partial [Verrucomicrobiota bacterium]